LSGTSRALAEWVGPERTDDGELVTPGGREYRRCVADAADVDAPAPMACSIGGPEVKSDQVTLKGRHC